MGLRLSVKLWLMAVTVALAVPVQQPTLAQTGPSKPLAPRSRLGVNIGGVRDWSPAFMFIDVMKSSRRFGAVDRPWEPTVPLDARGWPTTDAGVIAFSEAVNVNGVYRLSCTGRATIKVVRSPAAVRNQAYDAAADRTTCEIVYEAAPDKPTHLFLAFVDTADGVRDVKLLRPGYDDDAGLFTQPFLRSLEPFGCVRFMDYLNTNNSTLTKWDDRAKPSDAQYTSPKGAPYEFAIDLGNRLGKDIWLNVPHGADDAYVRALATLVKENLAPGVNCHVEWSNELWNTIFAQHKANLDAAREEVTRGERALNLNGRDATARHWGWRRTARRTVEISRIFREVCGRDPRIRVVLAGQHANPEILRAGLQYIETNHGPPRDFLYGIAIAPYFGNNDKAALKRPDLTVDEIGALLLNEAGESADARAKASHDLARRYGLKSLAYEGGIDLGQYDVAVEAKTRAQFDPRAGEAVERHLRAWFNGGGDAYCYYTHVSRYTKHGYWGLTDDARRLDVAKMRAARRVAETVP